MTGLQTTTTARRSNPVAIAAGLACAILGCAVVVGYALHIPVLVTIAPGFAPMRLMNATAFLGGGLALLALANGRRRMAAVCAAVPTIVGLQTTAEYVLGIPIQPWEIALLKSLALGVGKFHRPGALAGICFAAAGIALLLMTPARPRRLALPAVGLLGSIVASSAAVAFLSYLVGMNSAFAAGQFARLGVHTSLGLATLGAAIVRYAWRDDTSKRTGAPSWLPLLAAVATLTVTVCLREAMVAEDRAQLAGKIAFDAEYLKSDMETQLENRIQPLIRLARRRSMAEEVTREEWDADVRSILTRGGYQAIQWVDAAERNVWATPPGAGDVIPGGLVGFEARRKEGFRSARETRAVALTRPVDLVTGGKGFLACVPAFVNDEVRGYVVGVFRYQLLFAGTLNLNVTSKYSLTIFDGNEPIYTAGKEAHTEWDREVALPFHGAGLRFQLAPGENLVAEALSPVAGATVAAGCLFALLIALHTWLLQSGRQAAAPAPPQGGGVLEALVESSALPVVSYRRDGSAQAWNRAASELFGAPVPIRSSAEPFRILRITFVRGDGLTGRASDNENAMAMQALIESSSLPSLAFDSQGVFVACNRAATEQLGWTDAAWQGRRLGPAAGGNGRYQATCAVLIQGQTSIEASEAVPVGVGE